MPYDLVRGSVARLAVAGQAIDLGALTCVGGAIAVDRVTDRLQDADPSCADGVTFYLARPSGVADFGSSSDGSLRLPSAAFVCP